MSKKNKRPQNQEVGTSDPYAIPADLSFDEDTTLVFDARSEEVKSNDTSGPQLSLSEYLGGSNYPTPLKAGFKTAMKLRNELDVSFLKPEWEELFGRFLNSPSGHFVAEKTSA